MKRILVPVDFHSTSFSAFQYASALSKEFDSCEITLLHVLSGMVNTHDVVPFDPLQTLRDSAISRLKFFANEYPKQQGLTLLDVSVKYVAIFGMIGFGVCDYAEEKGMDYIVIGTRDTHGIFDRIIGSTSALVARKAECPVILIHEGVEYVPINKIIFAFDNKTDIEDALEDVLEFNESFEATMDFIHVSKENDANIEHETEEIVGALTSARPPVGFEISSVQGEDVLETLDHICRVRQGQILAMTHREEGVFSGIFRKKQSIKVAQTLKLPTIIFHE